MERSVWSADGHVLAHGRFYLLTQSPRRLSRQLQRATIFTTAIIFFISSPDLLDMTRSASPIFTLGLLGFVLAPELVLCLNHPSKHGQPVATQLQHSHSSNQRRLQQSATCPDGCSADGCISTTTAGGLRCNSCLNNLVLDKATGACCECGFQKQIQSADQASGVTHHKLGCTYYSTTHYSTTALQHYTTITRPTVLPWRKLFTVQSALTSCVGDVGHLELHKLLGLPCPQTGASVACANEPCLCIAAVNDPQATPASFRRPS